LTERFSPGLTPPTPQFPDTPCPLLSK
jgi:hypothetical protein